MAPPPLPKKLKPASAGTDVQLDLPPISGQFPGQPPSPDEMRYIARHNDGVEYDEESGQLGSQQPGPLGKWGFKPFDPQTAAWLRDRTFDLDSSTHQALNDGPEMKAFVTRGAAAKTASTELDQGAVNQLLRRIAMGEGTDDDAARSRQYFVGGKRIAFASGYDVPFNDGRYAALDKPLSQMTLKEVYAYQDKMAANPANKKGSTPVGKYQFRKATLQEAQRKLGVDDNAIFDAALQDRLARQKLEDRGLSKYASGKIDDAQFQTNLHSEWASIVDPKTGRVSRGQHLGTTTPQLQAVLRPLRSRSH